MILIDMDMPESCANCVMMYDGFYCALTGSKIQNGSYNRKRLSDCPIISKVNLDPLYLDNAIEQLKKYSGEPRYTMTLCIESLPSSTKLPKK